MPSKKVDKKFAELLEEKYGHLFDKSNKRLRNETISEDEMKLSNGRCIMENGKSICRINNVWIEC